jgi:hypothetical protein
MAPEAVDAGLAERIVFSSSVGRAAAGRPRPERDEGVQLGCTIALVVECWLARIGAEDDQSRTPPANGLREERRAVTGLHPFLEGVIGGDARANAEEDLDGRPMPRWRINTR